jgi:DNA-binding MarR family transcriptional regulator
MKNTFLMIDKNHFNKGLKPLELLILAQVEEFNRNHCECYITNQQFAEAFSVTQPTVDKALERLEKLKYIKRVTKVVSGNGRANKMRIITLIKSPKNETSKVDFSTSF